MHMTLITGNSTVYWDNWISTRHMPEQPPNTSKTGHFGVLHNKSKYTNTYSHVGSAPSSCLELKITTLYHLTAPAPPDPLLFSLDTCSIDTDHYANFRIFRKEKIESVDCAFY